MYSYVNEPQRLDRFTKLLRFYGERARRDYMWSKYIVCAVSAIVFCLFMVDSTSPLASIFRGATPEYTDEQITAWESGQAKPPAWWATGPDTQEAPKPPVSRKRPWTEKELEQEAYNAARTWNIHPTVFVRLVKRESKWRVRARSPLKYDPGRGLTQLRCYITARGLGYKDPCYYLERRPLASLFYGAKYLRQLVERYGNYRSAIAAYYAGPTRWNDLVKGKLSNRNSRILWAKVSDYLNEVIPKTVTPSLVTIQFNGCHERISNAACIWRLGETYEQSKIRTQSIYN